VDAGAAPKGADPAAFFLMIHDEQVLDFAEGPAKSVDHLKIERIGLDSLGKCKMVGHFTEIGLALF
jgi:hypothetical protein